MAHNGKGFVTRQCIIPVSEHYDNSMSDMDMVAEHPQLGFEFDRKMLENWLQYSTKQSVTFSVNFGTLRRDVL
eukprot:4606901-Amphidinium_carterae.1